MKKADIVREIKKDAEYAVMRGCILWCIKDSALLSYEIKKEQDWIGIEYKESESPPFYSCPQKYLDLTEPVNLEWRQKVRNYHREKADIKKEIRDIFQQIQHQCIDCGKKFKQRKEKILICPKCQSRKILSDKEIHLILETKKPNSYLNVKEVKVERIFPAIIGRCLSNYRLYKIPTRFIHKIIQKEK